MTTGTSVSGKYTGGDNSGNYFYRYRSWSGADSKYVAGQSSVNWNSYSMTSLTGTNAGGYNGAVSAIYGRPIYMFRNIDVLMITFNTTNFYLNLNRKLASALKDSDFNLGFFIAESHQTARMVANTVGKLVSSVRHLKKGRLDLALRALGSTSHPKFRGRDRGFDPLTHSDVGGTWLEMQYGWKPLLSDVHSSMEAYHKLSSKPRTVSGRVRHSVPGTNYSYGSYIATSSSGNFRAQYVYELYSPISVPDSLGLTDPLSIAWEILPFSFVFDWFIPVGNYLDSVHILTKANGRYLLTTKSEIRTVEEGDGTYTTGYYMVANKVVVVRNAQTTPLSVPLPQFEGFKLSTGHLYNSLALGQQLLSRH